MPATVKQPVKLVQPIALASLHPDHQERKRRLPKWSYWVLAAVLVAGVGWYWRSYSQSKISFETVPLERGSIQASVTATGTLNPVVNVQVGSQVSGNIKALYADFNTIVKKGQLVALIDPEIFQSQVDQAFAANGTAQAAVVTARAQVEKSKAELAAAIATRDNLQSSLAKDRANALNAKTQFERSDALFKQGIVAQQDHDTAKANFDAYEAQLTADQSQIAAAEQNIQSAQAQVDVASTQLSGAEAQERQSQAALAQARINLAHTRIVAPVSGTVIARHFDVGQTVAASFQAPDIFDIAQDLTKMQVDTNVDESDVGNLQAGQSASFSVDAYPGTTFQGLVADVRKAPISQQNVVTYDVVISVANPDIKLFPGMTANVTILTLSQDDTLKAPNAALRFHPSADLAKQENLPPTKAGRQQIYVLSGSKIVGVPVKLGISDGRYTAITGAGLNTGDSIVVRAISPAASTNTGSNAGAQRIPRM